MHRYVSSSALVEASKLLGSGDEADTEVLDEIVEQADGAALHAAAATLLLGIATRRPFGERSEHMALAAADLVYYGQGWTLPDGRGDEFDSLVQRVAAGEADVHHVAHLLAALARPRTAPT